jgi:hypothetical protein
MLFSLTGTARRNDNYHRQAMKTKRYEFGMALMLIAAMPGAAFGEEQDEAVQSVQGKPGCFYSREANDFDALDNRNFIVYAPTKSRAYHVQISPPSNELEFAQGLAFEARGGRVCGRAGESVSFGRRGGMPRRYNITNVWHVDADQVTNLKDQYKSPEDGKKIETKGTDGVEVERDLSGAEEDK